MNDPKQPGNFSWCELLTTDPEAATKLATKGKSKSKVIVSGETPWLIAWAIKEFSIFIFEPRNFEVRKQTFLNSCSEYYGL